MSGKVSWQDRMKEAGFLMLPSVGVCAVVVIIAFIAFEKSSIRPWFQKQESIVNQSSSRLTAVEEVLTSKPASRLAVDLEDREEELKKMEQRLDEMDKLLKKVQESSQEAQDEMKKFADTLEKVERLLHKEQPEEAAPKKD